MTKAIVPGSFDPVTFGHLDIIQRAKRLFDQVIVAVLENQSKTFLFSLEERVEMLREVTKDLPGVSVDFFSGLLVTYMKKVNARVIVRGLRALSDYEYELQMALTNHELDEEVETIFLASSARYSFLSSRMVKEVASMGGRISDFVPPFVEEKLRNKFKERG
ncbi:MAG: pantetheine-phosphate adenylyltransferase [Caldiserica bacterium]|nr:pantetheine-phosphate adenylyltransferase [Caldisericota bacterium]MDH7562955.1 pantetheine-phosphate adenylyltransferase [Caldisericota bacterium]